MDPLSYAVMSVLFFSATLFYSFIRWVTVLILYYFYYSYCFSIYSGCNCSEMYTVLLSSLATTLVKFPDIIIAIITCCHRRNHHPRCNYYLFLLTFSSRLYGTKLDGLKGCIIVVTDMWRFTWTTVSLTRFKKKKSNEQDAADRSNSPLIKITN